MPKRACLRILLPIIFLLASILSVFSQHAPSPLSLNPPLELAIEDGEKHVFVARIGAGETARVTIGQRGVDVSLAAVNPVGERFIETESPSGFLGNV